MSCCRACNKQLSRAELDNINPYDKQPENMCFTCLSVSMACVVEQYKYERHLRGLDDDDSIGIDKICPSLNYLLDGPNANHFYDNCW